MDTFTDLFPQKNPMTTDANLVQLPYSESESLSSSKLQLVPWCTVGGSDMTDGPSAYLTHNLLLPSPEGIGTNRTHQYHVCGPLLTLVRDHEWKSHSASSAAYNSHTQR